MKDNHRREEPENQESVHRDQTILNAVQRLTRVGGWEWDVEAATMFWSDELYRLHGLDPGDITPGSQEHVERSLQCYDPDDRPVILAAFNRCTATGEAYDLEFPFTTIAGNRMWIRTAAEAETEDGKVVRVIGTLMDVTDRKAAETALGESEAKFRLLYENAPVAYQSLDEDGHFLDVNKTFLDAVGYSREEIIGESFGSILSKESAATFPEDYGRFKAAREVEGAEFRIVRKDGSDMLVSIDGRIVRNERSEFVRTHCILRDITAQRAAENALRESEAILGSIFRSAPIGIGLVVNRVFQQVNILFCEMVGYPAGELLGKSARMVYPTDEDFEEVGKKKYAQISKTGVGSVETRLQCKNGEVINVLISSAAIDRDDISKGAVFTATDITHEKKMIAQLAESEKYYRSMLNNLHERIMVVTSDYRITDANETAVVNTGLDREEVIGRRCYEISHGYDKPCCQMGEECFLEQVFKSGEARSWLHEHTAADGSRSWVDVAVSPLRDSSGVVTSAIESMRDVTDLVETQESLKESEAFNRSIIASSPDATSVLDADGRLLFLSEGGQKLMEIGDVTPYLNRPWLDIWTGRERKLAEEALSDAQNGQVGAFQGYRPTATAKPRWWDVIVSPILDETGRLLVVSRDITARRKYETELRRQVAAIDQVDESIVITDRAGDIVYVNPAFERISGYARAEAIGQNPRILKSGKHPRTFYESLWGRLTGGKTWKGHFVNRRKDGSLFDEDASISPVFDMDGEIAHFVAVKRDVTRELENERHLRQAQKMEAIGTLAGGIAHDFNNILSSIIGFSELARDTAVPESRQYDHITDVLRAGKRAADLVRQILAVSRRSVHHREPMQIEPVLREAMLLIRASLPSTIQINETIKSDLGSVNADSTQIHQVVMNLCTNAHHAMRESGGVLDVDLDDLIIDDRFAELSSGTYIRLRVRDTGIGIGPDVRDRIFDPYFTTKDLHEGTGLGLSVVHGIVREHGGTITVDSEPAKGTVFTVLLPVAGSESRQQKPVASRPAVPGGHEHVLLVDDEEPLARVLKAHLEGLGYRVTMQTDSTETFAAFVADPEQYDLVVTDMTMPNMTGGQLTRKIREIRADIPVVICTGFSEGLDEKQASQLEIDAILKKPVDRATLARTVRKVLDGRT